MQSHNSSAYLVIRQGAKWTDVFRLESDRPMVIGRSSANDIPIADERSSRRHAEIYFNDGWWVRDLGSRNGTFVDGNPIEVPAPLRAGSTITVASCRMSFSHNLEEVAPPIDPEDPAHSVTQFYDRGDIAADAPESSEEEENHEELAPVAVDSEQLERSDITHRQSKSAILDPELFADAITSKAGQEPLKVIVPHRAGQPSPPAPSKDGSLLDPNSSGSKNLVASSPVWTLLQLAFELAGEANLADGCQKGLERLLRETGCQSGGILQIEAAASQTPPKSEEELGQTDQESPTYNVVAAIQRAGKSYRSPSAPLISQVIKEGNAVLARNILHSALGEDASQQQASKKQKNAPSKGKSGKKQAARAISQSSSIAINTTSAILAPIRSEGQTVGFVHLYSRIGEPDLNADDLEVALAMAEVMGTFFANLNLRKSLESKIQNSNSRIFELESQLGWSEEWIGKSEVIQNVQAQVLRVGPTDATVLLRGESGVGKEVVARSIHQASNRKSGPFVALNCAALTTSLLESELFGHEKGAFTGATDRKIGKFEQADQGTLLLDELGEMSLETQAKFLRVLEGKPFERVGGNKPIQVNVRVIAATNKNLEQAVAVGGFRSDLYFRLRVIELSIPPLRDRRDDILLMANHFLAYLRERIGHGPDGFSERAKSAMLRYSWPGNVRELKNAVERAVVLSNTSLAEPEDLALSNLKIPGVSEETGGLFPIASADTYVERSLSEVEVAHIEATLAHTGGQKNRAAAILGIERSTLDRKLKRMQNELDEQS